MIILSGVLVVVAMGLLGAGVLPSILGDGANAEVLGVDSLMVIYLSIAVSVVSALCLAIGVVLRRKELFGSAATAAGKKNRKQRRARRTPERTAPAAASGGKGRGTAAKAPPGGTAGQVEIAPPPAKVPGDAVVFVVRGRKRYHLATCRQLAGREREELTYSEAKEEGFSSCTACMPDTALAARAAVSVSAGPAGKSAAHESGAPSRPEPIKTTELPVPSDLGGSKSATGEPGPAAAEPSVPEAHAAPAARPAADDAPPRGFRSDPLDTGLPFTGPADREPLAGSGHTSPVSARPETDAPHAPSGADIRVQILSGTKRYHRPDCTLLEDVGDNPDDLESVSREEAKARNCTPCLVCRPDS